MSIYQILAFTIHGKCEVIHTKKKKKKSYKTNKFEISALTWKEDFELPVSDIQEYFQYILTRRKDKL